MRDQVLSAVFGVRKPDPRIFLYAAALLQTSPRECLHVGDAFNTDIVGAKSAGMLACWIKLGSFPPENNIKADFEIKSLSELEGLLSL